jgi:hypothetical protein
VHTWFLCGDIHETNDLEDLDVSGRVILKWVFKKYDGCMDWTDLAPDRDKWRPVLNVRVP